MNKINKIVMRNSITVRNWIFLSNLNTLPSHDNSISIKLMEDNNISNSNIKNILENVKRDYKNMDVNTAVNIINCIYKEYDENRELDLINLKEFEHICKVVLKNVRSLSTYHTLNILQNLLSLNVPPNSVIIQTLLQLIRVSVNNLTIKQIMLLYHTLLNVETSPLIESLLIALPHVLEQQAHIELDSKSTNLMQVLEFCFTIKNVRTQRYIISLLLKNERDISLHHAKDIFYVICNLPKLCPDSRKLLFCIQNKITINCDRLYINDNNQLLSYISQKCMNSQTEFYHKTLIDRLCFNILRYHTSSRNDARTIIYLNNMRYSNIPLLKEIVKKYFINTDTLKMCSAYHIHCFIKGFVIANYVPDDWETIGRMLQNFIIDVDYPTYYIASTVYHLLSLDCYCPKLIEKVFTLYDNVPKEEHKLKLYWCIKLLYPEYTGIMPDETKLNQIKIEHKSSNVPYLMQSLKEVVRGVGYIKSGLRTKFGTFVDHVVIMQRRNSLIDLNSYDDITFVEELALLTECKKILILAFPIEAYSIDGKYMLSTAKMELKALQTLGFYTIVINPYLWESLVVKEKTLYLRKIMKTRFTRYFL